MHISRDRTQTKISIFAKEQETLQFKWFRRDICIFLGTRAHICVGFVINRNLIDGASARTRLQLCTVRFNGLRNGKYPRSVWFGSLLKSMQFSITRLPCGSNVWFGEPTRTFRKASLARAHGSREIHMYVCPAAHGTREIQHFLHANCAGAWK